MNNVLFTIEKNYGLQDVKILRKVAGGIMSNNFVIKSANKKYFLKQYRSIDRNVINKIIAVELFFYNGGIPVLLPIKTDKNDFLFCYKKCFYSLFPFIDCKNLKTKHLTKKHLRLAASMLARMHLLSSKGFPDIIDKFIKKWEKEKFLLQARKILRVIKKKDCKDKFDKITEKAIKFKMLLVNKTNKKFEDFLLVQDHIIHGDFHEANIFFDNSGNVSYVYDFEQTGMAPRSLEIARAMDIMCFDGNFKKGNFKNAGIFLSEYNKNYSITKEEMAAGMEVYYLKKMHKLWIEEEYYFKNNTRVGRFMVREMKKIKYFSRNLNSFIGFMDNVLSRK